MLGIRWLIVIGDQVCLGSLRQPTGDEKLNDLAGYIGKMAPWHLKTEWKVLSYFAVIAEFFWFGQNVCGGRLSPVNLPSRF